MLQQNNETPLQLALRWGNKDVVQSILKEAKLDITQLDQVIILPLPLTCNRLGVGTTLVLNAYTSNFVIKKC